MARYKTDDGKILNSDLAAQSWTETRKFDGSNMISCATGSQWVHETLYRSRKGSYWIETESQWQGAMPSGRQISQAEAVTWLVLNNYECPSNLVSTLNEVEE